MGARQSRRSVDITTTPKKEGIPAEGGVVGDAAAPGDGKLERIEEADTKPTTNGIAPHTDVAEDKDKDKDDTTEKEKDKEKPEDAKPEETKQESAGESPTETAEVTTPTEATAASPNTATSPESKETKKKDKMKKKWSFRSISFSKKDKSKPAREEAPKNGDVTKEEPLAEGGEEAESDSATAGSPVEEKSAVSSPSVETEAAPVSSATPSTEAKEDAPATVASSPADEKQEEPTPSAPTPVPVEEKKEEVEKVEAEKKVVEVSPAGGQFVPDPVEVSVFRVQTVATPSIIERKTSEDIPSLPPSSPPPTPIDPSPLQQAQQAGATATALAEALKLPAEAAGEALVSSSSTCPERNEPSAESLHVSQVSQASSTHESQAQSNPLPPKVEALPVVDNDNPKVEVKGNLESTNAAATDEPEVQTQPVAETDAKSLDDPAKLPESKSESLPESKKEPETEAGLSVRSEPPVIAEKTDEIKVEERQPVCPAPENLEVVEPPVESRVLLEVNQPLAEDKAPEIVPESVERKEPIEIQMKDASPTIDSPGKEEEAAVVEEIVELNEVVKEKPERVDEAVIDPPLVSVRESIVESEEGPVPVSEEEIVVEAKPAVVIPEDEDVEEAAAPVEEKPTVLKTDTEVLVIEAIPEVEDKVETEPDVAVPTEDLLVFEPEDESCPMKAPVDCKDECCPMTAPVDCKDECCPMTAPVDCKDECCPMTAPVDCKDECCPMTAPVDPVQPMETIEIVEAVAEKVTQVTEVPAAPKETSPPPVPESPVPSPDTKLDHEKVEDEPTVPSTVEDVEPVVLDVEQTQEVEASPAQTEGNAQDKEPMECSPSDSPVPPTNVSTTDSPTCPVNVDDDDKQSQTLVSSTKCDDDHVPIPSEEPLPPAPRETTQYVECPEYPLPPPEELSCPPRTNGVVPEVKSELPVPDENASSLRNPTETLLTPPRSPSPHSNVSIASGLTTSTKDSSQTQLYDDQSNREFKMESVSISLNSYNESDIELKERLAESLAETVEQEESSVSCQLSNNNATPSATTIQETHQSTPEPEAPVENNVAHEVSTTESSDEPIKVISPAVPNEVPASPPSVPAITEDVASVAKAIEEMDISDKLVAAAAVECNTNEIIVDGHYQNNMNE